MKSVATHSPSSVASLDRADPQAGGASHRYGIQGEHGQTEIRFQHGPRNQEGSKPGVYDDDLLAIIEDRMASFQNGPFACDENERALVSVRSARGALSERVAARMAKGVLGKNKKH